MVSDMNLIAASFCGAAGDWTTTWDPERSRSLSIIWKI